jgi:ketohexokinase
MHDFSLVNATAVKVVDTIGAGDTFLAGVLYCLVCRPQNGKPWAKQELERILRYANGLAVKKVRQEGFQGIAGPENFQKALDYI